MPPNVKFQYNAGHWVDFEDDDSHVLTTFPLKQDEECETTIGRRLWKKRTQFPEEEKLEMEMEMETERDTDTEEESQDGVPAKNNSEEKKQCWEALKSIRILHDESTCKEWLADFGGTLYDIPHSILQDDVPSPTRFTAKVADFNDNLYYDMQTQKGLQHMGSLQALDDIIPGNEKLASFLQTESTKPQPAHVDYNWDVLLEQHGKDLQIGFAPLTDDGMFLQVWKTATTDARTFSTQMILGEIIYIPFGKLLTLPASTIHGGGFRTNPDNGNLRFHLYLSQGDSKLPDYQTNKYTEPYDKARELCDRYVDSPHMKLLLDHLFQ